MLIRSTDENNDWKFGRGKQDFFTGIDAVKQDIKTRLLQWKNDCFYAKNEGVDYNNLLSRGTKTLLDRDIQRVVLQTGSVKKITEYESSLSDRELSVNMIISTIQGDITLNIRG